MNSNRCLDQTKAHSHPWQQPETASLGENNTCRAMGLRINLPTYLKTGNLQTDEIGNLLNDGHSADQP